MSNVARYSLEKRGWKVSSAGVWWDSEVSPSAPIDAQAMHLLEQLRYVSVLKLEGAAFTNEEFAKLLKSEPVRKHVREIVISSTSISKVDLLRGSTKLKCLQIIDSPIECEQFPMLDCLDYLHLEAIDPSILKHIDNIKALSISKTELESLERIPIEKLKGLESLTISNCSQLVNIEEVALASSLQSVDLGDNKQLAQLTPLGRLKQLRAVRLHNCPQIIDISPLISTPVEELDLSGCIKVDMQPVQLMPNLKRIIFPDGSLLEDKAAINEWRQTHVGQAQTAE